MHQISDLKEFIFILLLFIGLGGSSFAQKGKSDSISVMGRQQVSYSKDSIENKMISLQQSIFKNNPYYNFKEKASLPPYAVKEKTPGRELYFYTLLFLFLFFAIIKTVFSKYFTDQISFFFRRGLKFKQLKSQMIQYPLPSLLFNIFFFLSGGFFIFLILIKFNPTFQVPVWQLIALCPLALAVIYCGKFLILKFLGWLFQYDKLTNNYIFTIFSINKLTGIFLLPLSTIISLSNQNISTIGWTLSLILISGMFIYRYIAAIGLIRGEYKISAFHFLLYVIAFEILPTIILYKGVINFLK